ncbi:MAG: ATP-dependent helicase [Frankiales bacterium]|nr:ATP-dependent helicase [Frankiales bacterium]
MTSVRAAKAQTALEAALAAVPGSQPRAGQQAMVSAVATSLASGESLLVQAGTGTGKSLGYLVPALASGKRVIVATATKALQAQLVDKDLPRLVKALEPVLGRTPTYALAKGRSNYVCLQQVHGGPGAREDEPESLFDGPASSLGSQVVRLREWAGETGSGDRDEVPFPVPDRAWRQVSVTARECLGTRCPDRVDCFSEKAREAAKEADIVVANHTLLALDVFTGVQVLPERDAVVLDEAHEFVSSVTDALSHELSTAETRRAVASAAGLVEPATQERLDDARDGLEGILQLVQPGWVRQLDAHSLDVLGLLEASATAACSEIQRVASASAPSANGSGPAGDEAELARCERARAGLLAVAEAAREIGTPSVSSAVYATADGATTRLRVSPLRVGGALASRLFGDTTVIATSATLTLGGSFRHIAGQLGLTWLAGSAFGEQGEEHDGRDPAAVQQVLAQEDPPPRWRHLDVGSPFDYARQSQLWVARSLPDPGRMAVSWAREVDALLVELVEAAGGRTLGLFSSTAAAARAAEAVRAATDLPILLQGEDSPGALQHRFASDARTCLFGTRSFWQGVDTPGSACQLVVIDRIPFGHVEDPLSKARLAAATDAGQNGFLQVTLPPAAILLAQGAGRLVRSTADRGVVVVLDPRLETAGYARVLLDSLPPFYRARSKEAVLASLRAIDADAAPVSPSGPAPSERRRAG